MEFAGLIPVIQCRHIEKTLDFYKQALRYIIVNKTETDSGLQWAYLKSDNTYLMLQKNLDIPEVKNSDNIILHYFTSNVSAQHQFMTARGIKVGQLEDTGYHMRQFYIEDPEGNKIAIGQDLKKQL